jgi:hypothetical protein
MDSTEGMAKVILGLNSKVHPHVLTKKGSNDDNAK